MEEIKLPGERSIRNSLRFERLSSIEPGEHDG
jgi:hypothetical protein